MAINGHKDLIYKIETKYVPERYLEIECQMPDLALKNSDQFDFTLKSNRNLKVGSFHLHFKAYVNLSCSQKVLGHVF